MAKRAGAVAKFLIKWLVIPVGLAAVGFFVVGPRIGKPEDTPTKSSTPPPTIQDEGGRSEPRVGEPEVEVTARPAGRVRSSRRSSSRRSSPPAEVAPASTSPASPAPAPTSDEPGGGTPPPGDG
ncbi:MAG TPA: hypothetical protein PLX06_05170 [Fimbriimonadaceae bacterium]|nr:hypothetical protein [Fimbriimonadaceae bacterium]